MGPRINQVIRISTGPFSGLYRVMATTPTEYFLGVIDSDGQAVKKRGPKPKRQNNPYRISTSLLILPHQVIEDLIKNHLLVETDFPLPNHILESIELSDEDNKPDKYKKTITKKYKENLSIMKGFLDPENFHNLLTRHRDFGLLIGRAARNGCDDKTVRRLLTQLIRFGLSDKSLIPMLANCGGKGKPRPFIVGKSKKPGPKTSDFKQAVANGQEPPPETPGMSQLWKDKCRIALDTFAGPHASNSKMYNEVLASQFMTTFELVDGKITPSLELNGYPTKHQFIYFLKNEYPGIQNTRRRTTHHNFNQNHRGLIGNSKEGVSGPGHTYAIDSTIGDIYLVSTLNRKLIIGRPVHYILVDVWSGAIVGFYVCLNGPSWAAAKVAIFCAIFDSAKLAHIRGLQHHPLFRHSPGLPKVLLGDRGEYIAHAASETAFNLKLDQEFTAPYRGDGKGIVEVQFSSIKDYQLAFIPGTHDAKRKEMEARKSKPLDATLTLHEYVQYLSNAVRIYNLTADMRHRSDDYMRAAGVDCTPASLWDWGHENSIGYRKVISESEIIRTCLPKIQGSNTPTGLCINTRTYANKDPLDKHLATEARAFGTTPIVAWIYPGNIQSIWTSHGCQEGLRMVDRSDSDSSFISEEEFEDATVLHKAKHRRGEHHRTNLRAQGHGENKTIIETSKNLKRDAQSNLSPAKQNITANREAEQAFMMHSEVPASSKKTITADEPSVSKPEDSWLDQLLLGGIKDE